MAFNVPLGFLISFRTYGTWLHGDRRGSVDRVHNCYGTPKLPPSARLLGRDTGAMRQAPVTLDVPQRQAVEEAIRSACDFKDWGLPAINVRTNHVHLVVTRLGSPTNAMNTFKIWSTRRLREAGLMASDTKVWSRHGSTRWLFVEDALAAAVRYVKYEQGDALGRSTEAGDALPTDESGSAGPP